MFSFDRKLGLNRESFRVASSERPWVKIPLSTPNCQHPVTHVQLQCCREYALTQPNILITTPLIVNSVKKTQPRIDY